MEAQDIINARHLQRLTAVMTEVQDAIHLVAVKRLAWNQTLARTEAAPEDIFKTAQAHREAEAKMMEAVQKNINVYIDAYKGETT